MIGTKYKTVESENMNGGEEYRMLMDRPLPITPKGLIRKRFVNLKSPELKKEYYANELKKKLILEAETVLRIPAVVHTLRRKMEAYDNGERQFKPFYKKCPENPVRELFLIGACAAPKIGYLQLVDRLENDPFLVTGEEYDIALQTPHFYNDIDIFGITRNPFGSGERRRKLRSELLFTLNGISGNKDLHEDSLIPES